MYSNATSGQTKRKPIIYLEKTPKNGLEIPRGPKLQMGIQFWQSWDLKWSTRRSEKKTGLVRYIKSWYFCATHQCHFGPAGPHIIAGGPYWPYLIISYHQVLSQKKVPPFFVAVIILPSCHIAELAKYTNLWAGSFLFIIVLATRVKMGVYSKNLRRYYFQLVRATPIFILMLGAGT